MKNSEKLSQEETQEKICPKCGKRGSGPYVKHAGERQLGLYFRHSATDGGVRRAKWHYVPKSNTARNRREEMLRLIGVEGWNGFWYYADRLNVSERTIRRYVSELRASRLLIHRRYGGYIADPTGEILKKNPWLAWDV
ncbi:MAG: DeoR family transcriptional regulator [Nitrososphaerales archaeon]|nr:DeoR family transcriptional regulator [Nitrososphaerales archaeon]